MRAGGSAASVRETTSAHNARTLDNPARRLIIAAVTSDDSTRRGLGTGLFFATFSTLLLEILDARLLSVLTWYHLSFFAVSLAMLGMASGAVYVFLDRARFTPDAAPRSLARAATWLALAIPMSHVVSLSVPFLPIDAFSVMEIASITVATVALAVPFVLSGVVVTAALTRCGGRIGRLYALDLIGAAAACLVVVPLLEYSNISAAILVSGAAAALAASSFHRFAGTSVWRPAVLALVLIAAALGNTVETEPLHVLYPKNTKAWLARHAQTHWNSHSYVVVDGAGDSPVFLWGPGVGGDQFRARIAWMAIDGEAGTPITQWDGTPDTLEWVSYDVTTLPYFIRKAGRVAVIGVGGGRDILAALWGRSRSITGIDVNQIMIDLLTGTHRDFARIADRPEVRLVHDDGRAYLTRTSDRFDVIQMSLVDTWAATGAGAFTLSENGLYTLDAWRVFIDRLAPGGVLSVSRWFDPTNASETSRLLALATGALLDRGVTEPARHIILTSRDRVATVMVSNQPFPPADVAVVRDVARARGFEVLVSPEGASMAGGPRLASISASRSMAELDAATAHPMFDYTVPTDRRPYYFNMLKPAAFLHAFTLPRSGVLWGNLRATATLLILLGVATVLVALIIVWPLVKSGRPPMGPGRFVMTMIYFGIIGFGYMLVQIGLLQRFSVFLGHPTYTLAIMLFTMLLFTGAGSLISERFSLTAAGLHRFVPATVAVGLALVAVALPLVVREAVGASLWLRSAIVVLMTGPIAMLMGLCFPIGVRLVRDAPAVVSWAWGVNGALGVLASIAAVIISIWVGIDANFWAAAALYLALTLPLLRLARPG